MIYLWGLPGGSNGEGPATLAGLLFVAFATAIVVAALVAALFYTVDMIEQTPRAVPLVDAVALCHNA